MWVCITFTVAADGADLQPCALELTHYRLERASSKTSVPFFKKKKVPRSSCLSLLLRMINHLVCKSSNRQPRCTSRSFYVHHRRDLEIPPYLQIIFTQSWWGPTSDKYEVCHELGGFFVFASELKLKRLPTWCHCKRSIIRTPSRLRKPLLIPVFTPVAGYCRR